MEQTSNKRISKAIVTAAVAAAAATTEFVINRVVLRVTTLN